MYPYPIQAIFATEAKRIIEERQPLGVFLTRVGDIYVGVDNRTGEAWTEEFRSLDDLFIGYCPTTGKVNNDALSFDDSSWYNIFMYKSIA